MRGELLPANKAAKLMPGKSGSNILVRRKLMAIGDAVGEFSFTASSVTVSTSADGGGSSQALVAGTVGY
jgi:hypothetical protein